VGLIDRSSIVAQTLEYNDVTRYVHLWQRVDQVVEPMVKLRLAADETRSVKVDFIYLPMPRPRKY
jgi:Protein of unknown function (DUF3370)